LVAGSGGGGWGSRAALLAATEAVESDNLLAFDSFSVPLRERETTFREDLESLWTDPRPVTDLIGGAFDNGGGASDSSDSSAESGGGGGGGGAAVPYVLSSGPFEAAGCKFEVLLYPRGLLAKSSSSSSSGGKGRDGVRVDPNAPASAYLRYLPDEYGDEIDAAWTLRLVDGRGDGDGGVTVPVPLKVSTSGGLPRSRDTWSSAMTLCTLEEAVMGAGRTNDWGSSIWRSDDVCEALAGGALRVEGNVTVFDARTGETSFSWPPGKKGGAGAVIRAAAASNDPSGRPFRAGEVIVPSASNDEERELMERSRVYPGVEYRVMTLTDADGAPVFSTEDMSPEERSAARLALRPVGWKTQERMWERRGVRSTDWPVEVEASIVSSGARTRFNVETFLPRLSSWIRSDGLAAAAFLALALAPVPLALTARNFVSLYDIPSASMDPTLRRGDVLLVEKFPGAYNRARRGDVVLFEAPPALNDIIVSRGGKSTTSSKQDIKNPFGGESLFVKRIVGMPGDDAIVMDADTQEVSVNGAPAVGPDRNLCADEPLKLIDGLLMDGKGKYIERLGEDDVYVLGDCKAVSVDSRVFGTLPKDLVVGRPVARIFPLSRFSIGAGFKL